MAGLMLMGLAGVLMSGVVAPANADEGAVRAVVERFAKAGDARDVAALDGVLHSDFRVTFTVAGTPGLTVMPRAAYLGAAKAGKIGGDARALEIERVVVRDSLAFVEGTLTGAKGHFQGVWTLTRTPEGWRLVHDAVVFAPK